MTKMTEAQYPKYSIQQQIGNCGQKSFEYHKPDNWISVPHSVDLGFDYWIHLLDANSLCTKTGFLVQVKSTQNAKLKNDFVFIEIETKNINYYSSIACPLMLIFCDFRGGALTPENATLYYTWFTGAEIIFHKKKLSIKIPTCNILHRKLDIGQEIRKFIEDFKLFRSYLNYYKDLKPPISFEYRELFHSRNCVISTEHVNLFGFLPDIRTSGQGSCKLEFALPGISECLMTFDHKTILQVFFRGALNSPISNKRKFIIGKDRAVLSIQLGNCCFLVEQEHVYELCSVIDRYYYEYINKLTIIEKSFRLRNFELGQSGLGYKLHTIPYALWQGILRISDAYDVRKGHTPWHIFYVESNSSITIESTDLEKHYFHARIEATIEYNHVKHINNRNVILTWKYPRLELQLNRNIEKLWDAEYCHDWLINVLFSFAIEHNCKNSIFQSQVTFQKKFPFFSKSIDFFQYVKKNGLNPFIYSHKKCQLPLINEIFDHTSLSKLIEKMHYFFSLNTSDANFLIDYTNEFSNSFFEAIIIVFQNTNNYQTHYLNEKLFGRKILCLTKNDYISELENYKNNYILDNDTVEMKLRAFVSLLRNSLIKIPSPEIKKIVSCLEWLWLRIEETMLINRHLSSKW